MKLLSGPQAAPTGFIAVAFLLQICQNVNLYGFDPPEIVRSHPVLIRGVDRWVLWGVLMGGGRLPPTH